MPETMEDASLGFVHVKLVELVEAREWEQLISFVSNAFVSHQHCGLGQGQHFLISKMKPQMSVHICMATKWE